MKRNYLIYALLMTVFLSSNVISAQNYFGDFPVKADPKTVGNKLSRRLMKLNINCILIEEYIMQRCVHGMELFVLQN